MIIPSNLFKAFLFVLCTFLIANAQVDASDISSEEKERVTFKVLADEAYEAKQFEKAAVNYSKDLEQRAGHLIAEDYDRPALLYFNLGAVKSNPNYCFLSAKYRLQQIKLLDEGDHTKLLEYAAKAFYNAGIYTKGNDEKLNFLNQSIELFARELEALEAQNKQVEKKLYQCMAMANIGVAQTLAALNKVYKASQSYLLGAFLYQKAGNKVLAASHIAKRLQVLGEESTKKDFGFAVAAYLSAGMGAANMDKTKELFAYAAKCGLFYMAAKGQVTPDVMLTVLTAIELGAADKLDSKIVLDLWVGWQKEINSKETEKDPTQITLELVFAYLFSKCDHCQRAEKILNDIAEWAEEKSGDLILHSCLGDFSKEKLLMGKELLKDSLMNPLG